MVVNLLTKNAISMMCNGEFQGDDDVKPVVQVSDIKPISAGQQNGPERYRILLSDGTHFQQGMLATQMNSWVRSGKLQKGSVVLLTQFVTQEIQTRRIIIIFELNVILENCDMIGDPKQFVQGGGGSAPQARPSMEQTTGNPQFYGDQNRNLNNFQTGGPQGPSNPYSRPSQPTYQQPAPMHLYRRPIAKNEDHARVIPIAALSPYQDGWTIKGRVTSIKDWRHSNNAQGEERVLSFDLHDSDGGEIKVTCFNAVADQFCDQIEVLKVYLISGGALKPTSKNFNGLQNEYEIFLKYTSTVQPCMEDRTIPW